jgi:beta-glucosidase
MITPGTPMTLRVRQLLLLLSILPAILTAQQIELNADFRNPELPPEKRAADLVARLTLEEKVLQMQNSAPAIPRLGIPAYDWWNEALHGVARAGKATVFPQAIGLAATWDTDLMHQVADTISTEARAKYNEAQRHDDHSRYHGLTFWSPNINIFRDPRWGRGQETYGEDPFLTSRMAVAFIQGMQGNDPHYLKTVATPKHFAVHSGPESTRHSFNVHPSNRDLEETYLPAFRVSVIEGGADSVMCAYNRMNGEPACANTSLLQDHLRTAWKFQGYVVSDCGAIYDILHGHKYKPTMAEAAALTLKAGTDLTCGDEFETLPEAVKRGLVTEKEIDQSLQRLFVARMRLGMFDLPERVPYAAIPYSENDSPGHRQLALQTARESIVLLKNEKNILPLNENVRRIAVIGPAADDPDTMLANYHGTSSHIVTPLEGMRKEFEGKAQIRFALGSTFSIGLKALVSDAVLFTSSVNSPSSQPGLRAEYFPNQNFQGQPALSRIEPRIYLQREMQDPDIELKLPYDGYSVRWTGTLHAPMTGDYKIGAVRVHCEDCPTEDSAQIYLDERLVVDDNSKPSGHATQEASVHLEEGRQYSLRVEYRQTRGGVGMQLIWQPSAAPLLDEAVKAVKESDVAVAFLGLNSQLEGEQLQIEIPGFSGGDRTSLDLPEPQEKLLEAAIRTGKPVIVVLVSGSAIAVNVAQQHAPAILEAWYGGEEGGTAIAQTLNGENNPSGRLPVTFYRSVMDLPAFDDYTMRGRTYRYFTGEPLYAFGYGLSYAKFRYSDLNVKRDEKDDTLLHISAKVENISKLEGDEVAQLYISHESNDAEDSIRELRGFKRVHLVPGASQVVEFNLDTKTLNPFAKANETEAKRRLRVSVGGGQPLPDTPHVESLF